MHTHTTRTHTHTHTHAQITKAVKQLKANYRLILSGTPIQVGTQQYDYQYMLISCPAFH